MDYLREQEDGTLLLSVHVQPRASRNRVTGLHDGAVKISLTAPPVDNKANRALIAFLAKLLHLPKSAISLKSGGRGRAKQFIIRQLSLAEARQILTALLE